MSDKQQAAADLKRLAVMFKGIIALADDLDSLGSMEQAELEAKSRVGAMQEAEKAAKDRVNAFDASLADKQAAARSERDQLLAEADDELSRAKEEAGRVVTEAEAKAGKIIASAEDRRKTIEAQNAARVEELQTTTAAAIDAQAKLDEINKQLEGVRRKISA